MARKIKLRERVETKWEKKEADGGEVKEPVRRGT